jgi:hypothetical protein
MVSYIDPGTGSMLFTILLGVLSAGIYALRGLVVKLRFALSAGAKEEASKNKLPFVIFSDNKRYWNIFEPICDELERRGVDLVYMTASEDDPALSKKYEHITSVSESDTTFMQTGSRLSGVRCDNLHPSGWMLGMQNASTHVFFTYKGRNLYTIIISDAASQNNAQVHSTLFSSLNLLKSQEVHSDRRQGRAPAVRERHTSR